MKLGTLTLKRCESMAEAYEAGGGYWFGDHHWWLYLPKGGAGNLVTHEVVEHEDGTITVTPSILIVAPSGSEEDQVHGFINKGVWTDA